jgi:circadian clock protein KaiC
MGPITLEKAPTGIKGVDAVTGGGLPRGRATLVTGTAGTGKTTVAAHLVAAACQRGEHALLVSFEESADQLVRNMQSVGIDLQHLRERGLLRIWSERASAQGPEEHLGRLGLLLEENKPDVVALDALGYLTNVGTDREVTATVQRQIDLMKCQGEEESTIGVTAITDTWLLLHDLDQDGERNRLLFMLKSRGMHHSNQVREFLITDQGAELIDVAIGPDGVLTGSSRMQHLARMKMESSRREADLRRRRKALDRRRRQMEEKITAIREALSEETVELENFATQEIIQQEAETDVTEQLQRQRGAGQ